MKKGSLVLLTALMLATFQQAGAQAVRSTKASTGSTVEGNSVTYNLPQTAITVKIVAQRETIKKGPYARFAQKYLGVVAPLTDKELYTIQGASLSYAEEADPSATYILDNPDKSLFKLYTSTIEGFAPAKPNGQLPDEQRFMGKNDTEYVFKDLGIKPLIDERVTTTYSNIQNDTGFVSVPIDKKETVELSLEDMAAEAANTIFTLRKRRFDLVTGEAGENVFGAGLQAAIDEMKRIEDEYIALFLGKRFIQPVVRKYEVVPEAGKNTVVVCRFSDSGGLLPDNDLSGRPIVLELTPEKKAQTTTVPRIGKDPRGVVYYRVADIAQCRLVDGKQVIVSERIPVYQFGSVVEVPVTSVK